MIVLTKENNIEIPNYDDLENKPSINGVVLEGNKTTEDLKIEGDLYDLGQGMKFESGTSVTRDVDSEFYFNTVNSMHDDKILIAIVDDVVKVFNLITENNRYLMFGSSVAESEGVLIDYITLTKVFSDVNSSSIIGFKLSYQSEYYSYNANVDLTGYATEQWVEDKGYLTSVPSEYVTETELNEAISKLDVGAIPYIIVKIEGGVGSVVAGSVMEVTSAKTANKPCLAYVYNLDAEYGVVNSFYLCNIQTISMVTAVNLSYHFEIENAHKTVRVVVSGWGEIAIGVTEHNYVTDEELNEALAGLSGSDIPYVCFLLTQNGVKADYMGDLQAVVEAVKNKSPYFAYAYSGDDPNNYGSNIAPTRTLIPLTATYNNNDGTEDYRTGYFGYHTELAGDSNTPHLDVKINFRYDSSTDSYILNGISKTSHNYITTNYYNSYLSPYKQDKLVSGTNIKTINGESILGSGNIEITTDLSSYATTSYVDTQVGNINTILENIIG